VGTDDGNVQVTRDGGKTWTNTVEAMAGLAPNAWVNKVEASHFDAGTAYVSASHWQDGDYAPYFFKTADFGRSWTRITSGLPARGWSHVIREDPKVRGLLYAGTEFGLYASWNDGAAWMSIRNNMPPVAVRDIAVHPRDNDIIVATHGRGIYILDDAAPLQMIGQAVKRDVFLFPIRPAIRWAGAPGMFRSNERDWIAPNPPAGAWINVYLKNAPPSPVVVTISGPGGKVVRTLRQRGEAGLNRFVWNLRHELPGAPGGPSILRQDQDRPEAGRGTTGSGQGGRGGAAQGPGVVPGDYTVKVQAGDTVMTGTVTVTLDPGVQADPAELDAQLQASFSVLALAAKVNDVIERVDAMTSQLTMLDAELANQSPAPAVRGRVKQTLDALTRFRDDELARPVPGLGYRQYPRLREDVQSLAGYVGRGFREPNAGERERMKDLAAQVDQAVAKANGFITKDITAINDVMRASPRISVEQIK